MTFRGKPIQGADPDFIVRLGIAHCPEERKIWPQMTVLEHLELGAFVRTDASDIGKDMAQNHSMPFHPGAEKYYREAGLLK